MTTAVVAPAHWRPSAIRNAGAQGLIGEKIRGNRLTRCDDQGIDTIYNGDPRFEQASQVEVRVGDGVAIVPSFSAPHACE